MPPFSSLAVCVTVRSSSVVGLDGVWLPYLQSFSSASDVNRRSHDKIGRLEVGTVVLSRTPGKSDSSL